MMVALVWKGARVARDEGQNTIMIWILGAVATFCFIASVLPFLPIPHGAVKAFDFPRLQISILAAVSMLAGLIVLPYNFTGALIAVLLIVSLILQLIEIARFSPLWKPVVTRFDGSEKDVSMIKMFVSNVKMGNRDYGRLVDVIKKQSPDIALFLEVDDDWVKGLEPATKDYEYSLACPNDTSYGMLLVSRFPLVSSEINYLLKEDVPSFDMMIKHTSGEKFRLIALHPEPPVLSKNTYGRDGEISLIAKKVRDYKKPLVVTGDLNDVAWSRTTRRFLRVSRLLDPREGRGMFNTFDSRYFFIRWPLDHIFHSRHFQIVDMQRMPDVGSDHFPMFYQLALTGNAKASDKMESADKDDLEEADDVVKEGKNDDEKAVGTDWED